ncbi:MAG: DUF4214 domain-containing protein, partial [Betaproteobacteria bacterium]|nr:DUF4214 domain-containing protein [Betaproteobacteria bacterium]
MGPITVKDTSFPTYDATLITSGPYSENQLLTFTTTTTNVATGTSIYWKLYGVTGVNALDTADPGTDKTHPNSGTAYQQWGAVVNDLYKELIGRYPDQGSFEGWVNNLVSGATTLTIVRNDMYASTEAQNNRAGLDQGSFTIGSDGTGSHSIYILPDFTTEGTETFYYRIYSDSSRTLQKDEVTFSVADTSVAKSLISIVQFELDSTIIASGSSTTLRWNISNAQVIRINGSYYASSGTLTVSPTSNTTYSLYAANSQNEVTSSTTLTIATAPSSQNIALGTLAQNIINSGSNIYWANFSLASSTAIVLSTEHSLSNVDTIIVLFNSSGNVITSDDDLGIDGRGVNSTSKISTTLGSGTYYVAVFVYVGGWSATSPWVVTGTAAYLDTNNIKLSLWNSNSTPNPIILNVSEPTSVNEGDT